MIYEKFNTFIKHEFFCPANKGSHIILSVDRSVIDKFCQENAITEQELRTEFQRLFSEYWNDALENENFFGLAAMQVYVAHLMEDEHDSEKAISARNYRERLIKFLQINESRLSILFRTDEDQDKLWGNLEKWAEKNDYNLGLPAKNEGPWSKVKYPLSQSLLNLQDFKFLPNLYRNVGLRPFEQLYLDDFIGLVEKAENSDFMPNHFCKVKKRLEKDHNEALLYKQMFEHYSDWDGGIIFENESEKRQPREQSNDAQIPFLIYNCERQEIQIFDNQSAPLSHDINSRNILHKIKNHFRLPYREVLFFTKDDYHGDWVFSRYLVKGEQNLIISVIDEAFEYHAKKIDVNCKITIYLSCVITELKIIDDYEPDSFWEKYFPKVPPPVIIKNGLKLDRKRWMYQAGPDLFFFKPVDAWLNGIRITNIEDSPIISLRNYDARIFILKIRGFSPIKIEIDKPSIENSEIKKGWSISKKPRVWKPNSEPFQICGLVNAFTTEHDSNSEIRDWINVNINLPVPEENKNNNRVTTNAINRSKYGIRY